MKRLSTLAARAVLLIGAAAWILGLMADNVHELVIVHATCEHGDKVELGHQKQHETQTDTTVSSLDGRQDHDHGCTLGHALLPVANPPLAIPVPTRTALPPTRLLADPGTPRGPPLAYAPKTSPPTA